MIGVTWDGKSLDLAVDAQGLLVDDAGFETPVLVSLCVDRRAPAGSGRTGEQARGYWADAFEERPWGSLLWLLMYGPLVEAEIGPRLRAYVEQALGWLVASGAAERVVVTTETRSRDTVGVRISIVADDGSEWAFEWRWTKGQADP